MVTLRVLTYNVHALQDDVAALARVVRSSGAQLVFMQEAPAMWRWRARCADLARRCGMVVAAGGGGDAAGNLMICSLAVDVHGTRSVRLPRLLFHRRRGAAIAHCSLGGTRFTAVGAHLSTDEAERGLQMRGLLAQLPDDVPPLVLGADTNEESTGEAWHAVLARLTDSAESAGGADVKTFSCRSPSRRIDGVFVDPRTVVRAYRVLDGEDVRRASDHFPVYAELELPN